MEEVKKELKEISQQLNKASKMHKGQANRIKKITEKKYAEGGSVRGVGVAQRGFGRAPYSNQLI